MFVSSVSSRIASVGAPLSDDERERKRAKKDSMLLSLALSTALVLPSRHAPVLMQQQGQYVVEPPPPKGFVWSTFSDMTGSVTQNERSDRARITRQLTVGWVSEAGRWTGHPSGVWYDEYECE